MSRKPVVLKILVVGTMFDKTGSKQFKFVQRKKVLCTENKQLQKDLSLHCENAKTCMALFSLYHQGLEQVFY